MARDRVKALTQSFRVENVCCATDDDGGNGGNGGGGGDVCASACVSEMAVSS